MLKGSLLTNSRFNVRFSQSLSTCRLYSNQGTCHYKFYALDIYIDLFHVPTGLFREMFNKIECHEIKQNKKKKGSTCLKIKIQEVRLIKYLMIKLFITGFLCYS